MSVKKKRFSKLLCLFMAVLMLLSVFPATVLATPASDIPSEMLDNDYLDALAYTGYDVQSQKKDGTIFKKYAYMLAGSSVLSGIHYDSSYTCSGLETASGKPNISKFKQSGLCCASYISYVYFNYLPNIAGKDTSDISRPDNLRAAASWSNAANSWVSAGKARRIGFSQSSNGSGFVPKDDIPIGSLIVFKNVSNGTIGHVALFAGYYDGTYFVTHVGNDRGPEISSIDGMVKGSNPEAVAQIVVPNFVEESGKIEVYKKDPNGKNLSGAYFTATDTRDSSKQFIIGPTNSNGYAATKEDIPYSTYKVVETVFPKNYKASGKNEWTVTVSSSNDGVVTINAVNELKKGYLEVIKTDAESGEDLSGAEFTVYDSSGKSVTTFGPTDKNGYAKSKEITYGSYTVKETKVPKNYQMGKIKKWKVTLNDDSPKIKLDITNDRQYGSVKVIKSAEDNFKEGFKFNLSGTSVYGDKINMTATTGADGIAVFDHVPIGTGYVISEKNTPIRYVVPENQTAAVEWNKVTQRSFNNILKKFRVEVTKTDVQTGYAQGDARLDGAVYGLYQNNELVASYTTDKTGSFISDYFICGNNWTLREITPSEGYLLDETIYHVAAVAGHYTFELNQIPIGVTERAIFGNIRLVKHIDSELENDSKDVSGTAMISTDGIHSSGNEGILEQPEAGAKFQVYLQKSGSYVNARESERDIITTDSNGFAVSKDLPYGKYVVHQIEGMEGHAFMPDFTVYIKTNGQTYSYILKNPTQSSFIRVEKHDVETGKIIPATGVGFQIRNVISDELITQTIYYPTPITIDTFFTNEEGWLMLPYELTYGQYELIEVETCYGYVLDKTPVSFTVDGSQDVVVVEKHNMPQKGKINVIKTGEVFSTVNSVAESETITYSPVYEIRGLEGATYEIRAVEDIYTPDGTLRVSKGEIVDTITTSKSGLAISKELYLGKYEIVEIKAPYGMVLNQKPQTVELVYAGQDVLVTETGTSFYNERQKAKVSLEKILEINEKFGIGNNEEIVNIAFGVFADEDIIAADGSVIPKDGLIELVNLDSNGYGFIKTDIPFGDYYLKEYSCDEHFIISSAKYPIDFSYSDQNTATVNIKANDGKAIINELLYGSVSGKKIDENGNDLAGAEIGLFASTVTEFTEKNAILVDISANDGSFSFVDVPYGNWIVREIEQPEGFLLSTESFPIMITEDAQVIEVDITNEFIRGDIHLTKYDKDYPDNKLSGAVFEVYRDSNDNKEFDKTDDLLGVMEETEVGQYFMTDIIYGGIFVKEKTAPEGFYLDENAYYVMIDTDGKTYEIENEAGKGFYNEAYKGNLKIVKTSSDDRVEGFSFHIVGENYDETFTTDENGEIFIENLRVGEYLITEVEDSVSAGYKRPEPVTVELVKDETLIVNVHNDKITVEVPKTGDDNILWMWIGLTIISAAGLVGTICYLRKKKRSKAN